MTDLFEERLTRALTREADRTPLTHPEWTPREEPAGRPPTPSVAKFAAAAAAVGLVVGAGVTLYAVGDRGGEAVRSIIVPPDGIEIPMVPAPTDGVTFAPGDPVLKPGSAYAFTVDDQLVGVSDSLGWTGIVGDPVRTKRCIIPAHGAGMCLYGESEESTADWQSEDSIVVNRLPSDTAFVTIRVGDETYWQDPLRDVALFADLGVASDETYAASVVLSDGEVVEVVELADRNDQDDVSSNGTSSSEPSEIEEYPDDLNNEMLDVVSSSGRACLEEAGLSDPLAPVPAGVDVDAVWNDCVEEANAAVDQLLGSPSVLGRLAEVRELQVAAEAELATSTEPSG